MTAFMDRLVARIRAVRNPVMVGLDPRLDSLPDPLGNVNPADRAAVADRYAQFCCGVIDAVANLVAIVKPQAAFFEQLGPPGMSALQRTVAYAQDRNLLVVIDAKRNDIGTTAQAYADAFLGRASAWGGDALTVSPYLGDDSLEPFVQVAAKRDAGIFVLVKTSNPGGKLLQDIVVDGQPLYARVGTFVEGLAKASRGDCGYGIAGAVVGATYPHELKELRALMPSTFFLVPGFGAQGGTAKDCAAAFDEHGLGAVINNSRGIIFAYSQPAYAQKFGAARWQDAVAAATRDMIDKLRAETTVGRL